MHLKKDQLPGFLKWLDDNGAEVLQTTNMYEVVRFKTANGVSVIYENKHGRQSFTGESDEAYKHFRDKKRWVTHNRQRAQLTSLKEKLAKRDGCKCFWCHQPHESVKTLTVEHILNKMHGGSDNSNNLSLACKPCQTELGRLPITQKILLRESKLFIHPPGLDSDYLTDLTPGYPEVSKEGVLGVLDTSPESRPVKQRILTKIFNRLRKKNA